MGGLGWLGRAIVDREARVRAWAHGIAGALAGAPGGHAFLSSHPHLSLSSFLIPTWLRHATSTVSIAPVSSPPSGTLPTTPGEASLFTAANNNPGASQKHMAHVDTPGAEVPLVRAACAWALGALCRGASTTTTTTTTTSCSSPPPWRAPG